MRSAAGIAGMMLTIILVGCKNQCFMHPDDFYQAHHLPAELERDPQAAVTPLIPPTSAPPTVDHPDRAPRYLSLEETIAIALENGLPSGQSAVGTVNDTLVSGAYGSQTANYISQTDRVRVIALQPATHAANIEAQLARFDATWTTAMQWSATDNIQQGFSSFENGSKALFSSSIMKAFSGGGVGAVNFTTDYQLLSNPSTVGAFSVINPLYKTRMNFTFEQPLWQNFGVEINQLLTSFPTPLLGTGISSFAAQYFSGHLRSLQGEGILLARLKFDQSRADFERNIHILLKNAEAAYWNLYKAYGKLYSNEEVMRLAHRAWMINKAKYDAGVIGPVDFAPIRGQYEEFRGERMKSLGEVLEAERNLRGILGLPVEDCTRLVPITPPTLAPYCPDWCSALQDALNLRPELIIARDNLRAGQFNVISSLNFLKPDLRFIAQYSPLGFGTRLDGDGTLIDGTGAIRPNNAFRSLAEDHFNDWTLGLVLNVPLGFRMENAQVRSAKLALAQSYLLLKDQEEKATRYLANQYAKITEWYRRIEATRAERKAYAEAVNARMEAFKAGKITADQLLESQRRLAIAQAKEFEAIGEYNTALALFEWARGTSLHHYNVVIAEGDLPHCAQIRAVEYERQRTKAILLAERPDPVRQPGCHACKKDYPDNLELPPLPNGNGVNGSHNTASPPDILPGETKTPFRPVDQKNLAPIAVPGLELGGKDGAAPPAGSPTSEPPLVTVPLWDLDKKLMDISPASSNQPSDKSGTGQTGQPPLSVSSPLLPTNFPGPLPEFDPRVSPVSPPPPLNQRKD